MLEKVQFGKIGLTVWVDGQGYEFPSLVPTQELVTKLFLCLDKPCTVMVAERSLFRFQVENIEIVIHD